MKHLIPLAICMLTSIILMYFEWYMWIDAGIGNANFYYGANLFYVLCNLYLICAAIAAARQYIYHKEKSEKDESDNDDNNQQQNDKLQENDKTNKISTKNESIIESDDDDSR